ncbi:MAG: YraN family protein [Candidatus Omnitrophica bacterium]|nr:YraN family protein [Candidatus Omnitrophota bacterium]MCK5082377.1 YraN family protein [Candidatus Omnitrophota bacterium]
MTTQRTQLGQAGEDAAVAFLEHEGYQILRRNFRNKFGEIDIIAKDRDTVCFVEVKTRTSEAYGSPFESVTKAKQRKIIYVALSYLSAQRREETNVRFDVVSVILGDEEGPQVEIIKNAFEAN